MTTIPNGAAPPPVTGVAAAHAMLQADQAKAAPKMGSAATVAAVPTATAPAAAVAAVAAAPSGPQPATVTIALTRPIVSGGKSIPSLTLTEPTLAVLADAERNDPDALAAIIAAFTSLPVDALDTLKVADVRAINAWIAGLRKLVPAPVTDPISGDTTFQLYRPLTDNGKAITSLTLREPDLASISVAAKLPKNAAHLAMIAVASHLAGVTVPALQQMLYRDGSTLTGWLDPFLKEPDAATT